MASTSAFVCLVTANAALILPSRNPRTTWRSLWQGLPPITLWILGLTLLALLGITHVPEGRQLFAAMSVRENLELGASPPHARPGRNQRLERVFALFPRLANYADIDAGALRAGEQQMVAIGRCLMAAPELILFDEPTRGLSAKLARQLFQLIGTLEAEGMTIILMEQNAPAALRLADSAHVLERGRIVLSGPGLDLLEDGRE